MHGGPSVLTEDPDTYLPTDRHLIRNRIACSISRLGRTSCSPNPAFLSYPTIGDVFGPAIAPKFAAKRLNLLAVAPRSLKGSNTIVTEAVRFPGPNSASSINAGVRQAGFAGLLIDQNGQPIFYAIHLNQTFSDFDRVPRTAPRPAARRTRQDGPRRVTLLRGRGESHAAVAHP